MPVEQDKWLEEVLGLTAETVAACRPPSETFGERCEAAARLGSEVAKLRRIRKRIGYAPVSINNYLQGIAKLAGVRLAPVLDWFDASQLRPPNEQSSLGLGRLCRALGMDLRQALVHLHLGFAESLSPTAVLPGVENRASRGESVTALACSEKALNQWEASLEERSRCLVSRCEESMFKSYAEQRGSNGSGRSA